MYYCSQCYLLNQTDCCGRCGQTGLPAVQNGDFCYLTTQSAPWSGLLQQVLRDNGVPCTTRSRSGAWLVAYFGDAADETEFFVPYEKLEEAQSLVEALFAAEAVPESNETEQ